MLYIKSNRIVSHSSRHRSKNEWRCEKIFYWIRLQIPGEQLSWPTPWVCQRRISLKSVWTMIPWRWVTFRVFHIFFSLDLPFWSFFYSTRTSYIVHHILTTSFHSISYHTLTTHYNNHITIPLQETFVANDILDPLKTSLWCAGKEFQRGEKVSHRLGTNEKTKVIAKLQKEGSGPPGREPVVNEEERKAMMAHYFKRQEELKRLAEAEDDEYLNSEWADSKEMKRSLQGLDGIKAPGLRFS